MPPFLLPPQMTMYGVILASCVLSFGPFIGPIIALQICMSL